MSRTEIRITGFGGQGVILAGHIIGRACAVEAGRHATMIHSFGPEARGSACSATLTVHVPRRVTPTDDPVDTEELLVGAAQMDLHLHFLADVDPVLL